MALSILVPYGSASALSPVMPIIPREGDLVRMYGPLSQSAVYLLDQGKLRPFPNEQVFRTWYSSFDDVKSIYPTYLEQYPVGTPMPLKPKVKLLHFFPSTKIYTVENDGTIRHLPNPETATWIYGVNWASQIISLPEVFLPFYTVGTPWMRMDVQI